MYVYACVCVFVHACVLKIHVTINDINDVLSLFVIIMILRVIMAPVTKILVTYEKYLVKCLGLFAA